MATWKYAAILLVGFTLLAIGFNLILGLDRSITLFLSFLNLAGSLLILLIIFLMGGVIGILTALGINYLDRRNEEDEKLKGWQHRIISIIFGIAYGVFHIWLVMFLLNIEWTFLHNILVDIGFPIYFETPPLIWGVEGLLLFCLGYGIGNLESSE